MLRIVLLFFQIQLKHTSFPEVQVVTDSVAHTTVILFSRYNKHHYYATPEETVAGVLKAGTDVDCTSFVGKNAQSALTKGLITEADIDVRLKNLFKVRMRLGHFDPEGPLQQFPMSDVCSE